MPRSPKIITMRSSVGALRTALANAGACPDSLDYLAGRTGDADAAAMVSELRQNGVPGLPVAHLKWSSLMLSQFRSLIDDALADLFLRLLEQAADSPTARVAAARAWVENSDQTAQESTRLQRLFAGHLPAFERKVKDGDIVRRLAV